MGHPGLADQSAVNGIYAEEDAATAEGLIAWISGQPNVAAGVKRKAGLKGDMDHFGALSFLQGLLVILRDSGHPGLLLVLDEVETLQRVRTDVRDKGLNALRQFTDEVDSGRFPGLYLLITGTPAFFDGPQGIQRLAPLAQRLNVDFATDARFDNPRAVQIRLPGFDLLKLGQVGRNIRDLFAQGAAEKNRILALSDDGYVDDLARSVTGNLGGKVGIAPRIFLRKLVSDVLDRIDQFPDFNPREHYALTLKESDLTEAERNAMAASSVNDIALNL
ncbi:MAG: BREX system ATP-binding protein BrxD [Nitrospirae bacterium]|nr:BREX system ATP-binding protein BrxD [Magnetococcales bacterium]